jgi:hypothetical protein
VNSLLVFGVPTGLVLLALATTSGSWPAEVTTGQVLVESLQFEVTFAVLGMVTGWRTWVHALRYLRGASSGWQGVGEAAAVGLLIAVLYLAPGIYMRPREALPYIVAYGGPAAILGAVVGFLLRLTVVISLRPSTSASA